MTITGVESIRYDVTDVTLVRRFFADWGLRLVDEGYSGASYACADHGDVVVQRADEPAVEVMWAVESKDALDAVASELSTDRDVRADDNGALHTKDESGHAVGFRVASSPSERPAGAAARAPDTRVEPPSGARPKRLGHVVYLVSADRLDDAAAFYRERLGFKLSDTIRGRGYFMRAPGSSDHHTLFLTTRKDQSGFNHVSFEVAGLDEMMIGGTQMERKGWKTSFGPGRHLLGSNLFWYFESPAGGETEYYADMDVLTDDWEPGTWEPRADLAYTWLARAEQYDQSFYAPRGGLAGRSDD